MTIIVAAAPSTMIPIAASAFVGVATGVGVTALGQLVANPASPLVTRGSIACSIAASAILGAAWNGTNSSAAVNAIAGAGASTAAVLSGPLGALVLGSDVRQATLDCWKPVLHEEDSRPSNGMLLRDVCADQRIKNVTVKNQRDHKMTSLPEIIVENIWNEQFAFEYVL